MKVATRVEAGGRGEDRLAVVRIDGRTLIAVADGAGGTGNGAAAAEVRGASAGDCGCWAIDSAGSRDLTSAQNRKPLLGTGAAIPTTVGPAATPARLLIATDGLWKYCPRGELERLAAAGEGVDAIEALLARVRLRSGGFQDDVAIALCDREAAET